MQTDEETEQETTTTKIVLAAPTMMSKKAGNKKKKRVIASDKQNMVADFQKLGEALLPSAMIECNSIDKLCLARCKRTNKLRPPWQQDPINPCQKQNVRSIEIQTVHSSKQNIQIRHCVTSCDGVQVQDLQV